jgi:tetratricopeptide (TPR) repeat protein
MKTDRLNVLLDMYNQDPNDSFVIYALAKEYETCADLDQSLSHFMLLQKNDPDYVGMYYHLGKLYEKLEKPKEALEIYETGIQISKKLKDFHALSELNNAKVNLEMDL